MHDVYLLVWKPSADHPLTDIVCIQVAVVHVVRIMFVNIA